MKSRLDIMTMAIEKRAHDEAMKLRGRLDRLERLLERFQARLNHFIRHAETEGNGTREYRALLTRCAENLKNVRAAKSRLERGIFE